MKFFHTVIKSKNIIGLNYFFEDKFFKLTYFLYIITNTMFFIRKIIFVQKIL